MLAKPKTMWYWMNRSSDGCEICAKDKLPCICLIQEWCTLRIFHISSSFCFTSLWCKWKIYISHQEIHDKCKRIIHMCSILRCNNSFCCVCLFQLIVHLTEQWIELFACHLHTLIRIKRIPSFIHLSHNLLPFLPNHPLRSFAYAYYVCVKFMHCSLIEWSMRFRTIPRNLLHFSKWKLFKSRTRMELFVADMLYVGEESFTISLYVQPLLRCYIAKSVRFRFYFCTFACCILCRT